MPTIPLPSIPSNSDVFIDANVLINAMLGRSNECRAFLMRCGHDINGYSDIKVLHDTMHKLMCAEAGINAQNLKKNPSKIRALTKWQNLIAVVNRLPVEWINIDLSDVRKVPGNTTSYGILCGDALITVLMGEYGIDSIASDDADFANIGLKVYEPTDI